MPGTKGRKNQVNESIGGRNNKSLGLLQGREGEGKGEEARRIKAGMTKEKRVWVGIQGMTRRREQGNKSGG